MEKLQVLFLSVALCLHARPFDGRLGSWCMHEFFLVGEFICTLVVGWRQIPRMHVHLHILGMCAHHISIPQCCPLKEQLCGFARHVRLRIMALICRLKCCMFKGLDSRGKAYVEVDLGE